VGEACVRGRRSRCGRPRGRWTPWRFISYIVD
jgi:hypothetical protein